jgi:uncharacterized protein (TIGR02391 family)
MLTSLLPPLEDFLTMQPEELAPLILQYLQTQNNINRYNFSLPNSEIETYSEGKSQEVYRILMETWMWLEIEGFLAPKPATTDGWAFVTRKGLKMIANKDFKVYQRGSLLPSNGLDPILIEKVRPTFIRGDYETAVFQAFREVEVRVRQKGNFAETDLGTELMSKAFKSGNGVLTDTSSPIAEQLAKHNLFSGAIGFLKNPTSHRVVSYSDPNEVADLVRFANQLLRLI